MFLTVNVALLRPAVQNSTWSRFTVASNAVDGDLATKACTHSGVSYEPWWSVDLGIPMDVGRVCVINDHNQNHGQ